MKITFVIIALLVTEVSFSQAEVGATCTSNDQCASDECCEIINIVVASRKRQLPATTGSCQRYKPQGAFCESYETLNGFCGCAEGLTCRTIQTGTTPSGKRGALPPGWEQKCLP